jgi:hypothetical protein
LCEIDVLPLGLVKMDVIAMVVKVVGSRDVEIRLFAGSAGHEPSAKPWQIAGVQGRHFDPPHEHPTTTSHWETNKIRVYTVKGSHKVSREGRILLAV